MRVAPGTISRLCALLALASTASCRHSHHHPQLITEADVRAAEQTQRPLLLRTIEMVDGLAIPIELSVTTKGNGVIVLGSLMIRIYDTHDDGAYYEPGLLDVTPVMSPDGVTGLRFVGTELKTQDDDGRILSSAPLDFMCTYNPSTRDFVSTGGDDALVWQIPAD